MIVSQHDKIENLNLSIRANNALRQKNIYTIIDFIVFPQNEFSIIRNIGIKTLNELFECLNKIKLGIIKIVEQPILVNEKIKEFVYSDGNKYQDIAVKDLGLSVRSFNCLINSGYSWVSEIITLNKDSLKKISNMGNKSVDEILLLLPTCNLIPSALSPNNDGIVGADYLCNVVFTSLNERMTINRTEHYNAMIDICRDYLTNNNNKVDISDILEDINLKTQIQSSEYIKNELSDYLLYVIMDYNEGCSIYKITSEIPELLINYNFINKIIINLLNKGKLSKMEDDIYLFESPSFVEGAKTILSDKEYNIFIKRTKNFTLEEIANEINLTRERVRQIEVKAVRKLNKSQSKFKEDIFLDLFTRYDINAEDFKIAFKSSDIYYYLYVRYTSTKGSNLENKISLNEALSDDNIPEKIKRAIEKAIYKNFVKIGMEYVLCTRSEIVNYVLRTFAINDITFNEFTEVYFIILEDIGKKDDEKLSIMGRGYENRIASSNTALWKYGKKLRYYNMNSHDYTKMFKVLNLTQYRNVEYSTKKFFKLYPEIMEEYDIRDEYELHNLLKKLFKEQNKEDIRLKRMPNIEFGIINRYKQVLNLLLALAPVSNVDLANAYEEEYGVGAPTVLANYVKEFSEYFHDGIYKIDAPIFSKLIADKLKSLLTDDFYRIEKIREIYKKEFSTLDLDLLNPFSIKSLGFKVYSSYVISDKFNSATEFINTLLIKEDILDINLINSEIKQLIQFTVQLYKLRANYEIVEFLPNKYISYKQLSKNGITREIIKKFNQSVFNYVGYGKYFTIKSLRLDGFLCELDEYGFEDWFYSSLLTECKEYLSYLKIGGNKLFMLGKVRVNLEGIIENLVFSQENLSIDIYDLKELLVFRYHIEISTYKLIETTKNTSMFYDTISEKIYADYDIYYEEI